MRNIFESVSASPRLRRFATSYMLIYFTITVALNLVGKYLPIVNSFAGGHVKSFVVSLIEGALLFGLIRGIADKDYRMNKALASFGESENYIYYLVYAAANTLYNLIFELASPLTAEGNKLIAIGYVLTITLNLVKFILNFALVRLYFEKILFKSQSLDLGRVCNSCIDTVKNKPLRIVAAEVMMLIVRYVSVFFATLLVMFMTSMVGTHWAVSFVGSCLVAVQFGALIYSWPVYYLYYKETCEE